MGGHPGCAGPGGSSAQAREKPGQRRARLEGGGAVLLSGHWGASGGGRTEEGRRWRAFALWTGPGLGSLCLWTRTSWL